MKVKALTLASVAGSLAMAGGASAAFTNITATVTSDIDIGGTLYDNFQIFVNYDNPADQTIALGGTPNNQQVLNSGGGGFWQQTLFGTDTAYNPAFVMFDPNLIYDSYVTIGTVTSADGMAPQFQSWNSTDFNTADSATTTNGGWFLTPDDPETISGGSSIVASFTVAAGNTVSGNFGQLQTVEDGVSMTRGGADTAFSFTRVPAPGTLALLGLAGLAGTRRRRA